MGVYLKQSKGGHIMQMDTQALRALCANQKAFPHEFFIDIMQGKAKCYDCDGAGLLRYRLSKKRQAPCDCGGVLHCWMCDGKGTKIRDERICVTCHGDGRGRITHETRLNAAKELAQYVAAKLKQVDHVSSDGSGGFAAMFDALARAKARVDGVEIHGTSASRLMLREGEHGD